MHYVVIPANIAQALAHVPRGRVVGSVNGIAYRLAIHRFKETGTPYLMLGLPLLRAAKAKLDDTVRITIQPDPEPDDIDMPEELVVALAQDAVAEKKFTALTPGIQRSLAYYVRSAKTEDTRIKRSLEMLRKVVNNELRVQRNAAKRGTLKS